MHNCVYCRKEVFEQYDDTSLGIVWIHVDGSRQCQLFAIPFSEESQKIWNHLNSPSKIFEIFKEKD